MFFAVCNCITDVVNITSKQFRLLLSKLNRIEEKVDLILKRTHVVSRSGTGQGHVSEVPSLPDDIVLPADSVRGLKDVAAKVNQSREVRKIMVSLEYLI